MLHVYVYMLAHKCLIDALKDLALVNFRREAEETFREESFAAVIRAVCATPEEDPSKRLFTTLAEVLARCCSLQDPSVHDAVRTEGRLQHELARTVNICRLEDQREEQRVYDEIYRIVMGPWLRDGTVGPASASDHRGLGEGAG